MKMGGLTRKFIFLFSVLSLFLLSSAQDCTSFTFSSNRRFSRCISLSALGSSLHWTYNDGAGTADVAYRASLSSRGWVAWGLNPTRSGMLGAQALVAIRFDNGSTTAYTTQVTTRDPPMTPGGLTFSVPAGPTAELQGGVMTIFATISLPGNRTSISHTWQASSLLQGEVPGAHPTGGENEQSVGTVDFLSGTASGSGNSRQRRRNTHGVLNAVSWGLLMPLGVLIARYVKVHPSADPAWFYLHVACQISAYVLGVAGWGTGLKLGSESEGITENPHRNIGIVLFCLATLQVLALFLRPDPKHKYRVFWNVYHRGIGYLTIVLAAVNIFKGFDILKPEKKWKRAYVGVLIALLSEALVLEILKWIVVLRRRSRKNAAAAAGAASDGYGYNGGTRQI